MDKNVFLTLDNRIVFGRYSTYTTICKYIYALGYLSLEYRKKVRINQVFITRLVVFS